MSIFKVSSGRSIRDLASRVGKIADSEMLSAKTVSLKSGMTVTAPVGVLDLAISEIAGDLMGKFRAGADPYGNTWERKADGSKATLVKSGYMRDSFYMQTKSNSIAVGNLAPYSVYHQRGTENMPQRLIAPTGRKGLPSEWHAILQRAFTQTIKDIMKK